MALLYIVSILFISIEFIAKKVILLLEKGVYQKNSLIVVY